jgi:hypothetical protein
VVRASLWIGWRKEGRYVKEGSEEGRKEVKEGL